MVCFAFAFCEAGKFKVRKNNRNFSKSGGFLNLGDFPRVENFTSVGEILAGENFLKNDREILKRILN